MKAIRHLFFLMTAISLFSGTILTSCGSRQSKSASEILGNPDYPAISYGGYRQNTREIVPTVEELKEDMRILHAAGIRILRTYNTQQFLQAARLLQAIQELKETDPSFEMYVMLGAWIDCLGAWTGEPDHSQEDPVNNKAEIDAAVELTKRYPDIVKVIAVGNEAMVHWAGSYFVGPEVILKWVNYLQDMKKEGNLPEDLWITSSDNFASWGGGDDSYHKQELTDLMEAVDYISMHTYPFHDSHYNPDYWMGPAEEEGLSDTQKIDSAMLRARDYAISQYRAVEAYMIELGIDKPIHVGETGWATTCGFSYGASGSRAADEYKQKLFYDHMREWTRGEGISCFFFEAFDEPWKDSENELGSENHFGLFDVQGRAKYVLWDMVDEERFSGLTRGGNSIGKSYDGALQRLMEQVHVPPSVSDPSSTRTSRINEGRKAGEVVSEAFYLVLHEDPNETWDYTYPSMHLKLNTWEGSCSMELDEESVIHISTGAGRWWGCALEVEAGNPGENLTLFQDGVLHFEIKGSTGATFQLGFQTGLFPRGDQTNNYVLFGPGESYQLSGDWISHSIPMRKLDQGAALQDMTSLLYLRADTGTDGQEIQLRNIYYSAN